ncbi:hypothetical protein DUNSADRAFT_11222 [Dunaliella salina]|uniref:Uncharacterized protein n=1 Tax=Dunaliella salina TaxID=3046 RepID=A0ABQ7GDV3_DUNSA|nr:hypothetical protein DUNSADRAFT_11222 [Dunaliella salina]|eukprot:KAF5832787.1 hypothetical protein DUNSADRAFT_11222 [Dunaliella salina]
MPRDGPAQPHVSTALHRRPHGSSQRSSMNGSASSNNLGASSHHTSSAQNPPLPLSASMPRTSNTHLHSLVQPPVLTSSASMPRRSTSGNIRSGSNAVAPPPPSISQCLESQRPGPSQTTASLASAAEAAVRRMGGAGGGGGGGAGDRGGAAILGTSRTSSGSSSAAGGGLSGVGMLNPLAGGKHGKQGVGQALFPTPQGALRAALSQQREVSKQAASRLHAEQLEDNFRVQPSSSGGAFTHQQLPLPRSPPLSHRSSAFAGAGGHSCDESSGHPSLLPAAALHAQHAQHAQQGSPGQGRAVLLDHRPPWSLPPKPSGGTSPPNFGAGGRAQQWGSRGGRSPSPPELESLLQGDEWPITSGGSLPEDIFLQGLGDRAFMPQPRAGSASDVTREKRISSGSGGGGASQPRGRQSLSQGNSRNLPRMHQGKPRLQPSASLSQVNSHKPSSSNILDTGSSGGGMQPGSGPLKKGGLDAGSALYANPGPTPFNPFHRPSLAGATSELFPIRSGRLGFHATSLPQTDAEDRPSQAQLQKGMPDALEERNSMGTDRSSDSVDIVGVISR